MSDDLYLVLEYAIPLEQLKVFHGSVADWVFLTNKD